MPTFETLTRRKKEIMDEVARLGEDGFHHYYWRLADPDGACKECKRRHDKLINNYDIKYTLDTEFCISEGDDVCAFELAPIKPTTVYAERDRLLEEFQKLEDDGVVGVRWMTADVEGLDDQCIKRHGRVYSMEQARGQVQGEFCKFANPAKGCECTFEPVEANQVEQVAAAPVGEGAAEELDKKGGCGATAPVILAFFGLAAFLLD